MAPLSALQKLERYEHAKHTDLAPGRQDPPSRRGDGHPTASNGFASRRCAGAMERREPVCHPRPPSCLPRRRIADHSHQFVRRQSIQAENGRGIGPPHSRTQPRRGHAGAGRSGRKGVRRRGYGTNRGAPAALWGAELRGHGRGIRGTGQGLGRGRRRSDLGRDHERPERGQGRRGGGHACRRSSCALLALLWCLRPDDDGRQPGPGGERAVAHGTHRAWRQLRGRIGSDPKSPGRDARGAARRGADRQAQCRTASPGGGQDRL